MNTMMRLLSVGRGIHGGKSKASPYKFVGKAKISSKMASMGGLNPFGGKEVVVEASDSGGNTNPAAFVKQRAAPIFSPKPATADSDTKVLERLAEPENPLPPFEGETEVLPDVERVAGSPNPFARNTARRRRTTLWDVILYFLQRKPEQAPTAFVQEELGLDTVIVKRNDLVDDDIEVVRAPRRSKESSGDTAWGRLNKQMFSEKKSDEGGSTSPEQ